MKEETYKCSEGFQFQFKLDMQQVRFMCVVPYLRRAVDNVGVLHRGICAAQFLVFWGVWRKRCAHTLYLKAHVDFVLANRPSYTRVAKCNARFSVIKRCAKAGKAKIIQRSLNRQHNKIFASIASTCIKRFACSAILLLALDVRLCFRNDLLFAIFRGERRKKDFKNKNVPYIHL